MGSIDPQIDDAVVLMKARAAKPHADIYATMLTRRPDELVWLAWSHLHPGRPFSDFQNIGQLPVTMRPHLIETMILCALALSLLPEEGE